ncbi:hypothetical protein L1887_37213 [Cichorium endivia]|nr:hypothetical protein L1887_37213 [Cichorium endivia]
MVGMQTKYLGGVRLALAFGKSTDARAFMENENKWKEWFKQLWFGDQYQKAQRYERTAWLKIIGLPLELWDEVNFSRIAEKFGRVGVVEYTDDWSPFKQCPFDKTIESEEEDNEDDDDSEAVSNTWANMEEDEPEDGEFRPETSQPKEKEKSNEDGAINESVGRNNNMDSNFPANENGEVPPATEPSTPNTQENEERSSSVDEILETIAVGTKIGFQIEHGNEMLAQIISDNGEHNELK